MHSSAGCSLCPLPLARFTPTGTRGGFDLSVARRHAHHAARSVGRRGALAATVSCGNPEIINGHFCDGIGGGARATRALCERHSGGARVASVRDRHAVRSESHETHTARQHIALIAPPWRESLHSPNRFCVTLETQR